MAKDAQISTGKKYEILFAKGVNLSQNTEREREIFNVYKKICVERKGQENNLHFIYFLMLIRKLILKRFDFFICIENKKLFVQDIQTV